MNKHREKCDHLKQIRKNMADSLGIELNQTVCTYEGDCKGTCPKCEKEERTLSKALLKGAVVATSATVFLAGCTNVGYELDGDVTPAPSIEEIDGGLESIEGEIEEPVMLEGDVEYVGELIEE